MRMLTGNKTLLKRIAYHITNTAWDSEAGKPDEWTKALEKHEDKSVEQTEMKTYTKVNWMI